MAISMAAAAGAGAAHAGIGLLGTGIQAGINAAAASKSNDRAKNWAVRKYKYELRALELAGINPSYMFMNQGNAMRAAGAQKVAQAQGVNAPQLEKSVAMAATIENVKAQTNAANSLARLQDAKADESRAAADRYGAGAGIDRARTREILQVVEIYDENPQILKNKLEREGDPNTNVQALIGIAREVLNKLNLGPNVQEDPESMSPEAKAALGLAGAWSFRRFWMDYGKDVMNRGKAGFGRPNNVTWPGVRAALTPLWRALGISAAAYSAGHDGHIQAPELKRLEERVKEGDPRNGR